jgi:hypothetical protein
MNTTSYRLERIKQRYNPEFDLIPDGPPVPWATRELVTVIEELVVRVELLEAQLDREKGLAGSGEEGCEWVEAMQ